MKLLIINPENLVCIVLSVTIIYKIIKIYKLHKNITKSIQNHNKIMVGPINKAKVLEIQDWPVYM